MLLLLRRYSRPQPLLSIVPPIVRRLFHPAAARIRPPIRPGLRGCPFIDRRAPLPSSSPAAGAAASILRSAARALATKTTMTPTETAVTASDKGKEHLPSALSPTSNVRRSCLALLSDRPAAIDLDGEGGGGEAAASGESESSSSSSSSPRRSAGEKDDSPPSTTTAYAPPEERYDWDDSFDYSSGVIAFHWSMSSALDALNTHNVFLSASSREDAERSWEAVRCSSSSSDGDGDASPPPPSPSSDRPFNFYVHRASATDPTAAPEGCDSIMVLVPCGTLRRNEEWANLPRGDAIRRYAGQFDERFVDATREAVLGRMAALDGLEDLRECIEDEVVDTPATYAEYYNLAAGTPFALSHGFSQLSLTRPGAQVRTVDNALFVGASSRPGNGVPLVLLGAKSVAEKVLRKLAADGDKKKKKKKKKES
mmetsp:Transcript_16789/g.48342  ORF Transcript_16789/g.48342 Transcript_16789/m.48342 type:complete len:425 (-) Transcript_16789:48-1322(-)